MTENGIWIATDRVYKGSVYTTSAAGTEAS
jgi:hypothetical protein